MTWLWLVLAAVVLVACGAPPMAICAHGENVYGDAAGVCRVADTVVAAAPCSISIYADSIHNLGKPFDCGGRMVHGCQDGTELRVESSRLIPDEYGHLIWEQCHGRSGEHYNAQGKVEYDADFAAWLETIK